MEIVIHRVNTVAQLRDLPLQFGAEIDIRADGSALILNHEPGRGGERLSDYLAAYRHGLLILDIKETGIEGEVLRLVRARGIASYFLLDVEFPYLYRASRQGERAIAVRYSEEESIETAKHYAGKVDWVWIDTLTRLPLAPRALPVLRKFKTCLVCPERWGRPADIRPYQARIKKLAFRLDAVMTAQLQASRWSGFATAAP